MTLYGYQCRECGQEFLSKWRGSHLTTSHGSTLDCAVCGHDEVKRKYSIATHRGMEQHLNRTTNTVISSDRQFRDELKRRSESEFLRTGIPCNYEPLDPDEAKAAVIASGAVGLDETNRVRVNAGKPPIRL